MIPRKPTEAFTTIARIRSSNADDGYAKLTNEIGDQKLEVPVNQPRNNTGRKVSWHICRKEPIRNRKRTRKCCGRCKPFYNEDAEK